MDLSGCTIFGYVAFPIVIQIALPSQCLEANEVFFKIDKGQNMFKLHNIFKSSDCNRLNQAQSWNSVQTHTFPFQGLKKRNWQIWTIYIFMLYFVATLQIIQREIMLE